MGEILKIGMEHKKFAFDREAKPAATIHSGDRLKITIPVAPASTALSAPRALIIPLRMNGFLVIEKISRSCCADLG